jgi:hypothetical protein
VTEQPWALEWRIYSDRIEPKLRGRAAAAAINRSYHNTVAEALRERRAAAQQPTEPA